jgi:Response regulators consisting of a CheY-like receiver domain and a winged-helix DNA-binding domain
MESKTILIVEDDVLTQKVYYQKLVSLGYGVILAATAKEGLSDAMKKKPSLILLDIMLSGSDMNGFDVLEFLKKNEELKKIPVMVLTNLDSEAKVAKEIGAVEYLVKANVSLDEVIQKIVKYLK